MFVFLIRNRLLVATEQGFVAHRDTGTHRLINVYRRPGEY
jgi:hypothetical protein